MNAIKKAVEALTHWGTAFEKGEIQFEAMEEIAQVKAELERLQRVEHLAGVLLYELDNDGDVQYIADAIRAALKGES